MGVGHRAKRRALWQAGVVAGCVLAPALSPASAQTEEVPLISEDEAIEIAIERGRILRAAPEAGEPAVPSQSPGVRQDATEPAEAPAPDAAPDIGTASASDAPARAPENAFRVTGDRVNLREGPGTDFAVVGQVVRDDPVEALGDASAGWVEIRLSDGGTAWISGQFLAPAGG